MKGQSAPLSRVVKCWTRFPQLVTNILVREKRPFAELDGVPKLVAQAEADLKAQGGGCSCAIRAPSPKRACSSKAATPPCSRSGRSKLQR